MKGFATVSVAVVLALATLFAFSPATASGTECFKARAQVNAQLAEAAVLVNPFAYVQPLTLASPFAVVSYAAQPVYQQAAILVNPFAVVEVREVVRVREVHRHHAHRNNGVAVNVARALGFRGNGHRHR